MLGVDADDVVDFVHYALGIGRRQVDLVEHRHDFQPLLDRRVTVGDALRLDALRGVDDKQCPFARRERP
jgi:hypothetical protein